MSRQMTASLRRRPSSPAAGPLEDDDLLAEILLRLPPLPSSLPRASAVSKLWRSLASDPRFCSRFRIRHRRNPPLLGCFIKVGSQFCFLPALEAPNGVWEGRFTFPTAPDDDRFMTLGCRHGLVLIFHESRKQLLVWDPATCDQHRLDIPPGFDRKKYLINGAVLRTVGDVHHFQVVLVGHCEGQHTRLVASVYSSETGAWCDLISTLLPSDDSSGLVTGRIYWDMPAVMVGDSLYWLLTGNSPGILEFDLARESLAVIPLPVNDARGTGLGNMWVIPAEDGGLGFLLLTGFCSQLWKRKTDCDGVASWVMGKTIQLDKLLSINLETERFQPLIRGFAEENNVVLLWISFTLFAVQLESLQFKKLFDCSWYHYYPFEGVYTAEKGIDGRHDGAELLENA